MNQTELFNFVTERIHSEDELESVSFYLDGDIDMNDIFDEVIDQWGAISKFGCSKLVLFFNEIKDYVIKIPFQGRTYIEYDDEEDIEVKEVDYFNQANSRVDCQEWDYCEAEALLYEEAKKMGVENFLTKTFYIGSIGNIPIYASEKIEVEWAYAPCSNLSYSDKAFDSAKELLDSYTSTSLGLNSLSIMIDQYGQEQVLSLVEFINAFDLDDFHGGNLGFTKDGMMKIIDYSCYDE